MKPKTKNQIRVVEVDKKIKPIGKRVIKWAENNIFKEIAFRYKSGTINCLKCGNSWQSDSKVAFHDEIVEQKCPKCKAGLKVKVTNNRTAWDNSYFTFIHKQEEFQLIRTCIISVVYNCKKPAKYSIREVQRIYIGKDGKREVIAAVRSGGWNDLWGHWLELRQPNGIDHKYGSEGNMYPKWDLHDFIIKAGFNAYVYNENKKYTACEMIHTLMTIPQLETIEKRGLKELYAYAWQEPKDIVKYWSTLKICFRNKYDLSKARNYFDMIKAIDYLKFDLKNSHYVCPGNLEIAHNYWTNKAYKAKRKIEEERNAIIVRNREIARKLADKELQKKLRKARKEYPLRMDKFKDLKFTFGDLTILPFLDLKEVENAGELMHHCIYKTESYWTDNDNLLLGSYWKGKLIETTQFSLRNREVLHSYGFNNYESKEHKKIVKIIETGMHKIYDCLKSVRKKRILKLKKTA